MASRFFESFSIPGLWKPRVLTLRSPVDVPSAPDTSGKEIGASGTPIYGGYIVGEDYNAKLDGHAALQVYDEMRRSDGQVAATLQALKVPLKSADWRVDAAKDGDTQDQAIADFCNAALFEQGAMRDSWSYILDHLLLRLDFGSTVLEKVWTLAEDGTLRLRRLAPRLPPTIQQWKMQDGELKTIVQYAMKDGRYQTIEIPAEYALVTVHQREGDQYYGRSILRAVYKHYYYTNELYRIDAIKHDRFGSGIPRAEFDASYTPSDDEITKAENILKGLSSNERSWIRTTSKVKFDILVPTGGTAGSSGLLESIQHHNSMIPRAILAGFLTQGDQSHGSFGLGSKLADFFTNAEEALADDIANDLSNQVVRALCTLNFNMGKRAFPRVRALNVSDVDMAGIAEFLSKLGKYLTPEDDLEDALRKMANLPPLAEQHRGKDRTPPAPTFGFGNPPDPQPAPAGPKPGATKTPQKARIERLRQSWQDPTTGLSYGRQPTALELAVFAWQAVPQRLNEEIAGLARTMAEIRRDQLLKISAQIAQKDSRETGPFTDIRPKEINLPRVADLERAIKQVQDVVAAYGAEQVRFELARQGAVQLQSRRRMNSWWHKDEHPEGTRQYDLDRFFLRARVLGDVQTLIAAGADEGAVYYIELEALGAADASKRAAKSALVASAKISAERQSDSWYARILEAALQLRRTGKQGDLLSAGIQDLLEPLIETSVKSEASAEVHEAFGIGRSVEAMANKDEIEKAIYSALLDANTCDTCSALDGEDVEMGSDRYYAISPPLVTCESIKSGISLCRCVWIYIGKDATV